MDDKTKMYAIIKSGGKQYRVAIGDIVNVELLDVEAGTQIELKDVLYANDGSASHFGKSAASKFLVKGEVLGEVKGEKVKGLKYKRSHNECRQWGHRQRYTSIKITGIGNHQASKAKGGHHGA